jgi:VIT1/CCC1 family predicted Fe2+/Mn2+ transporter
MIKKTIEKVHGWQTRFSFGSTSAVITNLALMAGLHSQANAKVSIIGGILVIALADNVADSFGIHIYQESEKIDTPEVWTSTILNFISRVLVSLSFVALMLVFPLYTAIITSIVWGLLLLAVVSYMIAKNESGNPYLSILTHVLIALAVIFISNLVGDLLIRQFGR